MPNRMKEKGTRFEYNVRTILAMLDFYVIRAYASVGVYDLIAVPPFNIKGNSKPMLIQCKDSYTKEDYIPPLERQSLSYWSNITSGYPLVVYKVRKTKHIMCRDSEESAGIPLNSFILKEYGIACDHADLISKYKSFQRPLHLYVGEKDENDKLVSNFPDLFTVDNFEPHNAYRYKSYHK